MLIALAAGALLVVYLLYKKGSQLGTAATNAIAQPIADAWLALTMAPPIVANTGARGVVMPDGSIVPLSSFSNITSDAASTALFGIYNGRQWAINGPVDANGNYWAS